MTLLQPSAASAQAKSVNAARDACARIPQSTTESVATTPRRAVPISQRLIGMLGVKVREETVRVAMQRGSPFEEGATFVDVPISMFGRDGRLENTAVAVTVDRCLPVGVDLDNPLSADGILNPWYAKSALPLGRAKQAIPALRDDGEINAVAMSTPFVLANEMHAWAKGWLGQGWDWGNGGRLSIFPYAYLAPESADEAVQFGSFEPFSRSVLFGVVPFASADSSDQRIFLAAADPGIAAHELGHAILNGALPYRDIYDANTRSFDESYGTMLSLTQPFADAGYTQRWLAETNGDWTRSSPASRISMTPNIGGSGASPVFDPTTHDYFQTPVAAPYTRAAQDLNVNYALLAALSAQLQGTGHSPIEAVQQAAELVKRLQTTALVDHMNPVRLARTEGETLQALLAAAARIFNPEQRAVLVTTLARFHSQAVVQNAVDGFEAAQNALPAFTPPSHMALTQEWTAFFNAHADAFHVPAGFELRADAPAQRGDGAWHVDARLWDGTGDGASLTANVASVLVADGRVISLQPALDAPLTEAVARDLLDGFDSLLKYKRVWTTPLLLGSEARATHAIQVPRAITDAPLHHQPDAFTYTPEN